MKKLFYLLLFNIIIGSTYPQNQNIDSTILKKAEQLCKNYLLIDTHIDLPDWLYDEWFDVTQLSKGEIDYPRAIKGGLDVPFMSIYTSPGLEGTGKSKIKADSMISLVHKMVRTWPDKFVFIRSFYSSLT